MDDPKSRPRPPHPELTRRGADERKRREPVPDAAPSGTERAPLDPDQQQRADRLIRTKGLHHARQLDPSIAGHCIECGLPVEGNRAFCSDACITRRVNRNREKVAELAHEARPKKKPPKG